MKKIKLYDVVISAVELENVPKGSTGTVLIIYEGGKNFEVEFLNNFGDTLNVLTVGENEIEKEA